MNTNFSDEVKKVDKRTIWQRNKKQNNKEDHLSKARKQVQFKNRMLENERKIYNQKLKQ